jgi:hypothetical protein
MLEHESDDLDNSSSRADLEASIEKRRLLSLELESLLNEIRSRPGFSRFLNIPNYEELSKAAERGPVVILLEWHQDAIALVIKDSTCIEYVPLEGVTKQSITNLRVAIRTSGMRDMSDTSVGEELERGVLGRSLPEKKQPLAQIWLRIVKPIIQKLGLQVSAPAIQHHGQHELMSNRKHKAERDHAFTGIRREASLSFLSTLLVSMTGRTRSVFRIMSSRRIPHHSLPSFELAMALCPYAAITSRPCLSLSLASRKIH